MHITFTQSLSLIICGVGLIIFVIDWPNKKLNRVGELMFGIGLFVFLFGK